MGRCKVSMGQVHGWTIKIEWAVAIRPMQNTVRES